VRQAPVFVITHATGNRTVKIFPLSAALLAALCLTGVVHAGPPITLQVFDVQGNGLSSPHVGAQVLIPDSIVTAVMSDGFYLQTPDDRADSDTALTSNGIRVVTAGAPLYSGGGSVQVGHRLDATGVVVETGGETRLQASTLVRVGSDVSPLPAPIVLSLADGRPRAAADNLYCFNNTSNFECFEGSRISLPQGRTATGNATAPGDAFGPVYVSPFGTRSLREKGVRFGNTLVAGENELAGIWDGNPEVLRMDADRLGAVAPGTQIAGGVAFTATGVLAVADGDYTLWPSQLSLDAGQNALPAPLGPLPSGDSFRIASFDLTALCDAVAGNTGTPCRSPEPSAGELTTQLARLSAYMNQVLGAPAVIAVQHVENVETLDALGDALGALVPGSNYVAHLLPGNGTNGLDVGFLVDDTRIDNASVTQLLAAESAPGGGLLFPMPPLLLSGSYTGSDNVTQAFRIINVRLDDRTGVDAGTGGARERRFAQAFEIAELVQAMQLDFQGVTAPVIVAGKLYGWNETDGYVDVVGLIAGSYFNGENLLDVNPFNPVNPLLFDVALLENAQDRVTASYVESFGAIQGVSDRRVGVGVAFDHLLLTRGAQMVALGGGIARANADAPLALRTSGSGAVGSSEFDALAVDLEPGCRADPATNNDGDEWCNTLDNCPNLANNLQLDFDGDRIGDDCDDDVDGDTVPNGSDNCPALANPDQSDLDGDTLGDVCDDDIDGDGDPNGADNCPLVANPGQEDFDNDNAGDACDPNADMTLALVAAPSPVAAGGTFTVTATMQHAGPQTVTSPRLRLTLPAQASFVSASAPGWTCAAVAPGTAAAVLDCQRDTFAPGTLQVSLTATAAANAVHGSLLLIEGRLDPADIDPANNVQTLNVPVQVSDTDLRLIVFGPSPQTEVGAQLPFTATINNLGQRAVNSLEFRLPRPAGTQFSAITPAAGWTCPAPGPALAELVCTRALAAGDQTQIEFTLEVLPAANGTQFGVQPVITSEVTDSDASNNAVTLTFTVGSLQTRIFTSGFEGQ
jgi:hypothetical protein